MNARDDLLRRVRRGRMKSWAWTVAFDAALIWCALSAAQSSRWLEFAMITAAAVCFTGFCLWLDRAAIHVDHFSQPLTGRDADRLARWRLRVYQKHCRPKRLR